MLKDKATRNLDNFLSTYTLPETTELLNQVFDQLIKSVNSEQMHGNREQMLDFLEALEELIPGVYTLNTRLQ